MCVLQGSFMVLRAGQFYAFSHTHRESTKREENRREHCQAFWHVVYFVYKRVPLTYFVPHNEHS